MAEHAADISKNTVFNTETVKRLFAPFIVSLAVLLFSISVRTGPSWTFRWQSPLLFHLIEGVEFLSTIFIALFLFTRKSSDASLSIWIPAGLFGMGVLDWASNEIENEKVWLLTMAMLFCGFFFAAGSLPFHSAARVVRKGLILSIAGIVAFLIAAVSYVFPGIVPEMVSGGRFNTTAVVMNTVSGLLFLSAAVFFLKRYLVSHNSLDVLLFYFLLLNGAAELAFKFGIEWAGQWWSWHIFRLVSCLSLLVYAVFSLRSTEENNHVLALNFQNVLATSMDGFYTVDREGGLRSVNDAYCRMTGYGREELLQMSLADLEAVEDEAAVARHMKKIIENGGDRFETKHRRKDGKIIEVEASVHALPDNSFLCFIHDISRRRQMLMELERSEEELSVILENIPMATALMDENRCIVRVNAAMVALGSYTGDPVGKCVGQIFDCIYFSYNPVGCGLNPLCQTCGGRSLLTATLADGRNHYQQEWRLSAKAGTDVREFDLLASTVVLPSERKLVLLCLEDVSGRKKMQQQLIMNDRLASIGLLASGVAHEVGNPLTVITGYAHTLPLLFELPDGAKEGLKIITEESRRAGDILKNLLTFARAEPISREAMNLNGSIRRVLELRAFEQKVNKISSTTDFDESIPDLWANRSRLEQVFYNIVVNAEFAMVEAHQNGNLVVKTSRHGDMVRISFADDGPGIAEKDISRIFTPFFTTKKIGQGTGLGLSICLGIVNDHGGRLWAESDEGKGATFFIELPIQGQLS